MDYKVNQIKLSEEEVLQKIKSWCAYQERSHHETRQKLAGYRLPEAAAEAVIAHLITENFLNEERFALALAGGKFRMKGWGREKIRAELRRHKVSDHSIRKALAGIDPDEYERTMERIIAKKASALKASGPAKRYYALRNYLISRGYESDLVHEKLSNLQRGE